MIITTIAMIKQSNDIFWERSVIPTAKTLIIGHVIHMNCLSSQPRIPSNSSNFGVVCFIHWNKLPAKWFKFRGGKMDGGKINWTQFYLCMRVLSENRPCCHFSMNKTLFHSLERCLFALGSRMYKGGGKKGVAIELRMLNVLLEKYPKNEAPTRDGKKNCFSCNVSASWKFLKWSDKVNASGGRDIERLEMKFRFHRPQKSLFSNCSGMWIACELY